MACCLDSLHLRSKQFRSTGKPQPYSLFLRGCLHWSRPEFRCAYTEFEEFGQKPELSILSDAPDRDMFLADLVQFFENHSEHDRDALCLAGAEGRMDRPAAPAWR